LTFTAPWRTPSPQPPEPDPVLKTLDRYILRQVATPLTAALAIGLSMMLAERLVRLLDVTLGKNNSFGVVFEMLGYLVPHYLATAIPAALFLGLLLGFNRLSKNSEITAALASGVGLHRLARPAILLSVAFLGLSLAVYGWLKPISYYAYRSVLFNVKNVEIFYLAEEGVFMQSGSRTFILDKLDHATNTFERIFLFDYKGPGGSETLTATNGRLIPVPGEKRPVLRLENGHRLVINRWPTLDENAPPPVAETGAFGQIDTPLGKLDLKAFRPRGQDERELTLPELYQKLDAPPEDATPQSMRAEFHKRLVSILSMLILPFLAIPFAIGDSRSPRSYRIGVALVILIAYHEIIEQGAIAIKASGAPPLLAVWLPFVLLASFALWRFREACIHLRSGRLDAILETVYSRISPYWKSFRRRIDWEAEE